ncbi:hypothetical protein HanRHA438_Chr17g0802351 [Helianthus annuus]|nr:hypothetical protein HanRHA438_Chr17g0802351 [Helianthus annuus]
MVSGCVMSIMISDQSETFDISLFLFVSTTYMQNRGIEYSLCLSFKILKPLGNPMLWFL